MPTSLTRRVVLGAALAAITTLAAPRSAEAQSTSPAPVRNLVFILADDLGVMDLACQGSDYYKTPHIDALAKSGIRFTNAYAAAPICSPTRAAILTGRAPARIHLTGVIGNQARGKLETPPWLPYLQKSETTYAERFADAGFKSLHIGKWHVSTATPPTDHGFARHIAPNPKEHRRDPWQVESYTKAAEDFIDHNKDQRFLLVISHGTPHVPLHDTKERIAEWQKRPPGKTGQNNPTMGAMIQRLDDSVGRVVKKIRDAGLEDQTAIIFTSDNGGLMDVRDPDTGKAVTATSNLPYRGGKSQLYEGGIRIPLIIRCPGRTAAGTTSDVPVISTDLYPTFLDIVGLPPDPKQHLDGLSLTPLFDGKGTLPRTNLFWHYPHYQTLPPHGAVRSANWKLIVNYETDTAELFDLAKDPGEKNDLAVAQPDITNKLRGYLRDHLKAVGGQLPKPDPTFDPANPPPPLRTPPGIDKESKPVGQRTPITTGNNGAQWPSP